MARVGGDEFAIIQIGIEQPLDTAILARRIGEAVRAPYELAGHAVVVDTSIGIAMAPERRHRAGRAAQGRRHGALRRQGRRPRHLPLLRAGDGHAHEGAARARDRARARRWRPANSSCTTSRWSTSTTGGSPAARRCCAGSIRERGMIPPAEFIPVAEEIGLIVPLGEWVLRKACIDAASWPDDIKVAVNLSPVQVDQPEPRADRDQRAGRRRPPGAAAGDRDHRIGAAAQHRDEHWRRCTGCASSACASRWTISAPAIRR